MWNRIRLFFRAKMSRILDRAEDPGEMLDYSYEKQLEALQQLRKSVADLVTSKKRIQMQRDKQNAEVVKLADAARKAMEAGNEDLARRALERKQFIQDELTSLDTQVAELEAQQEAMIQEERAIQQKVERFRTQKEVSKAQYGAAKAQVAISETAAGLSSEMDGGGLALQRATEKVENMKARAGAMEELEKAGTLTDLSGGESAIDREIHELTSTAGVDAEMEKLRLELNPDLAAAKAAEAAAIEAPSEGGEATQEATA